MTTGSEIVEESTPRNPKKLQSAKLEPVLESYNSLTEAVLLRHFANAKNRKPN